MARRTSFALLATSLSLVLAHAAAAQEPPPPDVGATPRAVGAYEGVVPGEAHDPSHLRGRAGATPAVATWPGFQPRSDGASRFFLQTTAPVSMDIHSEHGRFVVVLHGLRIPDRQTRRALDTRFFNTPVTRSWVERRGRHDVAFVLELRADVTPTVTTERGPDGYTFFYVSFAAGEYLPPEPANAAEVGGNTLPSAPPPPAGLAQRAQDDPSLHTMDNERPPAMQGHGPNP